MCVHVRVCRLHKIGTSWRPFLDIPQSLLKNVVIVSQNWLQELFFFDISELDVVDLR